MNYLPIACWKCCCLSTSLTRQMFFCTCPSKCPQIFRNHSTTMASLTPLAPTARSIVGEEEVGIHILQCLALRHCFSAIGPFSWSFFHPVCCSTQISPRKANLEPTRVATCANQMNVQIIEPHITLLPCCLMCFFGGLLEEKKKLVPSARNMRSHQAGGRSTLAPRWGPLWRHRIPFSG